MAVDALARALAAGKTPVTAYEEAVKAGYTGTEEQFAQDMGNSGTNAANAAASASAAAASAASVAASAAQITANTNDISDFINEIQNQSTRETENNLVNGKTRSDTQVGVTLKKVLDVGVKVNGTVDVSAANQTIYLTNNIPLVSGKTYTVYIDTTVNPTMPSHGAVYLNGIYHNGTANISVAQNTIYKLTPDRNTNLTIRYYMGASATVGSVVFTDTVFMLYVVEGTNYTLRDFNRLNAIESDVSALQDVTDHTSIYAIPSYDVQSQNLAVGRMRPGQDAAGVTIKKFTEFGVTLNGTVDISVNSKTVYMVNNMPLTSGHTYTVYVDTTQSTGSLPEAGYPSLNGSYVISDQPNYSIRADQVFTFTATQNTNMQIVWYMAGNAEIGTVHFNNTVLLFYVVEGYDYAKEDFIGKAAADAFNPYDYEEKSIYSTLVTGLPIFELSGSTAGMTKENAVTLDWKFKGDSGTATVKWQGSSSLNYPKKNYSIKLDHNIDVGWGAQKKYVLKGEFIDNSHALNIGSAKLWGAIVYNRGANPAIGNSPNNGAMTGFPVMVLLNGRFHGLFMFNTPKDPWTFGMGNSTTEYIVTAEAHTLATQFKALAELDGTDFELEYKDDSVADATVKMSLNTMIQAILDAGENWETTVGPYLDIDSAIDYYIFCALTDNHDGFDKNFILTTYDGTKWWFNAYDMDSTMGNHWTGGSYRSPYETNTNLNGLAAISGLFSLIYTYSKEKLVQRYNTLRQGIMSDGYVASTYYNHVVRIPEEVYRQDTIVWPMLPGTWTNNVARISDFYRMRSVYIDREVEAIE